MAGGGGDGKSPYTRLTFPQIYALSFPIGQHSLFGSPIHRFHCLLFYILRRKHALHKIEVT